MYSFSAGLGRSIGHESNILDLRVQDPGLAWRRQQPRWELINALTGGTYRMHAEGKRWLPQEPRESDESYQVRLSTSICPPYFQRMEAMLAGMITRKPIRLDAVPDVITEHLYDVDLQANDLQVWAYHFCRLVIRFGHAGVLVDYGRGEDGQQTDRPYWLTYQPSDILDFRTDLRNGTQEFTMLRLYERLELPYGEFGVETVEQVRVLEPGSFRLFRKQPSKGGDWTEIDNGQTSLDYIPFAVAYANRVGLLESAPPLEEIAWLNLKAYRCDSDQSNLLHISATPRQFLYGVPAELDEIEAGPESAIALPQDARVEFVEPAGQSFQARFQQLEKIEQQINQLGLAAIIGQKMAAETATAKSIDRSQGDSALMNVALQLQDLIDNCLKFHADYLGIGEPGSSMVNTDFVSQRLEPAQMAELVKLWSLGGITLETLLIQLADGEIFVDDFDVDAEVEATNALREARMQEQEAMLSANMNGQQQQPQEQPEEPAEQPVEQPES
jgi:hypothetical protein